MKKEIVLTLMFIAASFVLFFTSVIQLSIAIVSLIASNLERLCNTMNNFFTKRSIKTREYIVNL